MNNQNNNASGVCDPVEITDKKTGLKKVMYLCAQPVKKRAAHYKENKYHFWTDLGLIATIIILVATIFTLWIFNALRHTNLVDFQVNYNTEELVNGQRINFTIEYLNTSKKKPVTDAEVIVRFPDGLLDVVIADQRYDQNTQTIAIGNLEPHESGSFDVSGLMLSDIGSPEKFVFVLNYFNDLGQAQQEFTAREFVVENSIVDITLSTRDKILVGSDFTSTITVINNEDYEQPKLKVLLNYPESYVSEDGTLLSLESLVPGETLEKKTVGVISQAAPGGITLVTTLLTEYNGKNYVLNKAYKDVTLAFSKLRGGFINTDQNAAIKPGEQTVVTVQVENNENFVARDIAINYVIEGDFTDVPFLGREYPKISDQNTVTFEGLGELGQNETLTHEFKVAALPSIYITSENIGPQNITVKPKIRFTPEGSTRPVTVNATPLEIPINSNLALKSFGLFFSSTGDQLGVGSLPPRPGEYTSYWAIIRATNGVNTLRNVTVRADIPAGSEFTDLYNVTYGAPVRYIPDQNKVEWYLGDLDPYAGLITAAPEARIQMAVVPSDGQVGQVLPLLTNITITGVDDRTGEVITASGSNITTAIFGEDYLNRVNP